MTENRPSGTPGVVGRSLVLGLAVLILDQLTKWWVVDVIMRPPHVIEVTPFFNIVMAWNRGVSFGLLASDSPATRWILLAVALAVSAALAVWLKRTDRPAVALAIGAIIGGAIGNAIDRVRWGAVADFLDVHAFGWHWPAFNVADTGITVGATVLIIDSLFDGSRSPKTEAGNRDTEQ